MKNLFTQAVGQVDAAHATQPIAGNEKELSAIFAKVYQRSEQQGFGLAQLMSASSFVKAANKNQGEINEIIDAVKAELNSASCRFDDETQKFLQNALSKGPDEFVKVLQQASTQQAEVTTQAESSAGAATTEEGKVVQLVPPIAEQPVIDNEKELKTLLAGVSWLPVNLPDEPYNIIGLPASTFDRLWGQFNARLQKTSAEKRAFELLDAIKGFRDGESAQKVGWKIPTSWKSCWNMQLFFIFKNYYVIIYLNIILI